MTKDVLVKISGMQFSGEGVPEPVEIITSGTYYKKNDKHYILYDEIMEGFPEVTKNTIKVSDHAMDILKKGVVNVHMVFEENKKNVSYYYTPYGSILLGIDAGKIEVSQSEDELSAKVKYRLELNYEHLADCTIQMDIQSRPAKEFHI